MGWFGKCSVFTIFRARADALSWALGFPYDTWGPSVCAFVNLRPSEAKAEQCIVGKSSVNHSCLLLPLTSAASEPKVSREFSHILTFLHLSSIWVTVPSLTHKCNQWSPCYGSNEYFSVFLILDPLVEFSTIDQFLLFLVFMTYTALSFSLSLFLVFFWLPSRFHLPLMSAVKS